MKGGKAGRERRSGGGAPRQGGSRTKPKKGSVQRPTGAAPKKGSRKKPEYGGTPTSSAD